MDMEKSSCSANNQQGAGSAPRIMKGFSIECILAKPDRLASPRWPTTTTRNFQFPQTNAGSYMENSQQDYAGGQIENKETLIRSSFDGRTDRDCELSRDDGYLKRSPHHLDMISGAPTPDSSSVIEPANATTGSEDGDYGSEESGCKLYREFESLKITQPSVLIV